MNILIISDPLESFKPYKDSTLAIIRALSKRGIQLSHALMSDLSANGSAVSIRHTPFSLVEHSESSDKWYRLAPPKTDLLNEFKAILIRTDPPFDLQYLYGCHLLSLSAHPHIFNNPQALQDYNEKLAILHFEQWIAPTIVTTHAQDIHHFLQQELDIIVKPLDGMAGREIYRLRKDDPNKNSILESLMRYDSRTIMAQRYIPEIRAGDKRVLVIDGHPIDYALARMPQKGEVRANLAVGGTGIAQHLTLKERKIAQDVGPTLKDKGVLLAGLDIIGGYLTEINVTSPTGFQEITYQTNCPVADIFVEAVLNHIN